MSKKLYLFDLDHTLLRANASYRFFLYLLDKGEYSARDALFTIAARLRFFFGFFSTSSYHDHLASRLFFGKNLDQLISDSQDFVRKNIEKLLYLPVLGLLERAKREGALVALASGSPDFIVSPIADYFGIAKWAGTRYTKDGGGRVCATELFLGAEEKVAYVKLLAEEERISLENLVVVTDSICDLPLLEIGAERIAVQPDRRLRKMARERGWPIV